MSILTISSQHSPGEPSKCSKTGNRNKSLPDCKGRSQTTFILDNVILNARNPKKYTHMHTYPPRTNKWV